MNSTEVQNPRRKLDVPVQSLITCFISSLTRFADFVSLFRHYNTSSDSKAFLRFIAFSGSPTPCFPFLRCDGVEGGKLRMREWVELFDEPRPFTSYIVPFVRISSC